MGRDQKSRLYVKIKFINSGTEKIVRYDLAIEGKVSDELYEIDFNKIYNSMYYGPFKITEYKGRNSESKRIVKIKFLNTNYECDVLFKYVKTGQVIDKSVNIKDKQISKNVSLEEYNNFIVKILHSRWSAMMQRCYNSNNIKYYEYGAIGITVCDKWKTFDGYLSTIHLVKNFNKFYNDPLNYHIDKDYLQQDINPKNKIYSPETCIFLSAIDNDNLSMKNNHIEGEYYGVKKISENKFQVLFSLNGTRKYFGTYSNIIAAANMYNYYYLMYHNFDLIPLLNNVEIMTYEEAQKYLII